MEIVMERPPNFERIAAVFPDARKPGVIFTFGARIYNPSSHFVSAALRAHEAVHSERQARAGGPEVWWDRYLVDQEFRLAEELPAHRAEYRTFCSTEPSRERRASMLDQIAQRLASPLYGSLISVRRARGMLR